MMRMLLLLAGLTMVYLAGASAERRGLSAWPDAPSGAQNDAGTEDGNGVGAARLTSAARR